MEIIEDTRSGWLQRYGGRFTVLANLSVVLLCLSATAVVTLRWLGVPRAKASALAVGTLGRGLAAQFPHNHRTVLIALSSECGVCVREASLYREIERSYASRSEVGFVYLMPDIAERGRQFLSATSLTGVGYFAQDPGRFGMSVPAVAIVDRAGTVRFLANGPLDPARRKSIDLTLNKKE
jgi:hypothetical protein